RAVPSRPTTSSTPSASPSSPACASPTRSPGPSTPASSRPACPAPWLMISSAQPDPFSALVRAVHDEIVASPGPVPDRAAVLGPPRAHDPLAPAADVERVAAAVAQRVVGLGPLEPLLADADVTEVMVNGPGQPVWIERGGRLEATAVVLD